MAHGQWSEVEARGVLNALAKSELSVEKFCLERGITPQRVYWWKKKLGVNALKPKPTSMALLPVRVVETPVASAAPARGEPVTVLLRSGHVVKVGRGFDEDLPVESFDLAGVPESI